MKTITSFVVCLLAVLLTTSDLSADLVTGMGEIDNTHATLFARYDADNYNGTTWTDSSSGAGNDLTLSAGDKPDLIVGGGPNGQNFADFDGNDRIYASASDLTGGQYTVFMVSRLDSITDGYFFDGTTSSQRGALFAGSGGAPNKYSMYGGGSTLNSTADAVTGEWLLHTLVFDNAGTSSHSINGALQYSGSISVGTWQTIILGARYTQGNRLDGGIADFLVYNEVLDSTEIGQVETALNNVYFAAIPEPSSFLMMTSCIGFLAFRRRR